MAEQPRNRRPRFRRTGRPDLPPFELQERDREILRAVHQHRVLTSELLRYLIPTSPTPPHLRDALARRLAASGHTLPDTPKREGAALLGRLQRLWAHRYLERVKLGNNAPILYGLGPRGAEELLLTYGIERSAHDLRRKNREAGQIYLRHVLMVAAFRIALERALARAGAGTLLWVPEGHMLRDEVTFVTEGWNSAREPITQEVRTTINPDGFFAIKREGHAAHHFLECDRSNATQYRFLLRMKGYLHWYSQGKCKDKLGVDAFPRIVTVTKTAARRDNLWKLAKSLCEKENDQEAGWLFWFCQESDYRLDQPASILRPIWRCAVDNTMHGLLE